MEPPETPKAPARGAQSGAKDAKKLPKAPVGIIMEDLGRHPAAFWEPFRGHDVLM